MDEEKIRQGVRLLLEGIGEDPDREGLAETPERIARMCGELFVGLGREPEAILSKTFAAPQNDLIVEKDIVFYSVCEHHLLPFFGKAHIAYVPEGRVAGLSKLARTVELYARRPQVQERMTAQIADAVMRFLGAKGVIVLLSAEHTCMTMRGVGKPGTKTTTLVARGVCESEEKWKTLFFRMLEA